MGSQIMQATQERRASDEEEAQRRSVERQRASLHRTTGTLNWIFFLFFFARIIIALFVFLVGYTWPEDTLDRGWIVGAIFYWYSPLILAFLAYNLFFLIGIPFGARRYWKPMAGVNWLLFFLSFGAEALYLFYGSWQALL